MIRDTNNAAKLLRINLHCRLQHKPYFFDVQNRQNDGLVILVHNTFDEFYVKKLIRQAGTAVQVKYKPLNSVNQYLHWLNNWDNSVYSPDFLQARSDVKKSLEAIIDVQKNFYAGVKIMDMGMSKTVIDFACKKEGILYLCKVATSDRKDSRKEKSLKIAEMFFMRRYRFDLKCIESYLARVLPGKDPYFVLNSRQYSHKSIR